MSAIDPNIDELLSLMQEEAAEIIQIISKIRRFGFQSYHPDDPNQTSNETLLTMELADLDTLVDIYDTARGMNWDMFHQFKSKKLDKLRKYSNVIS